jgi:hypothetical protein
MTVRQIPDQVRDDRVKIAGRLQVMIRGGLAMLLCLTLSSCGFKPQYAPGLSQSKAGFDQVDIPHISDRYGQVLHNNLTNTVGEGTREKRPYVFNVGLTVTFREIGYEKNLNTSRSEVLLVAPYQLIDRSGKRQPQKGMCRTSEYFSSSLEQIFQNVTSEKNAPLRGLETLTRCLVDRLSILLKLEEKEHEAP